MKNTTMRRLTILGTSVLTVAATALVASPASAGTSATSSLLNSGPVWAMYQTLGIPTGSSVNAGRSGVIATCSNGNFRGEAEISTRYTTDYYQGSHAEAVVTKYKITKSNGQQGGNHANVNLRLRSYSPGNTTGVWGYSSDNLLQNSTWQKLGVWEDVDAFKGQPVETSVEFVFDKTGSDPKCTAKVYAHPY